MNRLNDEKNLLPADRMLDSLALALLGVLVATCLFAYLWLPDRMVIHFDRAGRPDGSGSKAMILALPAIGVGLYGLLHYLGNLPVELPGRSAGTSKGSPRAFRIVKVVSMLCLLVVALAMVLSS